MVFKVGDHIALYFSPNDIIKIVLKEKGMLQTTHGAFNHDDIIGLSDGDSVYQHKNSKNFAFCLELTPEIRSNCLNFRTQIVYTPDLGLIGFYLNCFLGAKIIESGTGSGGSTVSFSRSVGSTGVVYTFESNVNRYKHALEEFKDLKIENIICECRDVYEKGLTPDGLDETEFADGVFLDLCEPWRVLKFADQVLKCASRIVCFLPCMEQVVIFKQKLEELDYQEINCVELLVKPWFCSQSDDQRKKKIRVSETSNKEDILDIEFASYTLYSGPMRGHRGYIIYATKPARFEQNLKNDFMSNISRLRVQTSHKSRNQNK